MVHEFTPFFELDPMRALLSQEWDVVRQAAPRVPSGNALSLAPSSVAREAAVSSHPAMMHLHFSGNSVRGDLCCTPDALPIDSDSIQLLVARHVFDVVDLDSGVAEEMARVLAPGGTLFLFGMNQLSPWRLWSAVQARGEGCRPRMCSQVRVRHVFTKANLQLVQREFLGGAWPGAANEMRMGRGGRLDGAWVLLLAKQRSAARVIPLRRRHSVMALGNGLAQVPSRRTCL